MFICLHCGGLPFNGDTIKKQSLGGSETAAYYMALELARQGHKVTIFTNSPESGLFDGVKYEWSGDRSEEYPLGNRFTFYAENTPADVLIIQRHPEAFTRKWAAKVNLLWLHDLAQRRYRDMITGQLWQVDGILTVSEFHRQQVVKEWGLNPDNVFAITNGVDLSLFDPTKQKDKKRLVYSSRPERGLENLVGPDGIMEQLAKIDPAFHLTVCGYENTTPQMRDYYEWLWARCEELPNVTNVGPLTKFELAELMASCGALVYPTEFEEVSCITAMEAMAAGLPMITSRHAALPETCAHSGTTLIPLKDGKADKDAFLAAIISSSHIHKGQVLAQMRTARAYDWSCAADRLLGVITKLFESSSVTGLAHHFIRHSDIPAFEKLTLPDSPLANDLKAEYERGYKFYRENTYAEHYAAYYEYEKARGVNYGPEDVSNTGRFAAVANMVASLPSGSRVLDYGCAHGHYTINLAKRFPKLEFIGHDIAASNVAKAKAWATEEGLTNVTFNNGDLQDVQGMYHLIIAAEVIEHVGKPQEYVDSLCEHLLDDGRMVITTPYGPWEAQGYREHGYWRAHLHHFERADIHDAFGHHPEFKVIAAPSGASNFGSVLGSYIFSFTKPTETSKPIDLDRKIRMTIADQMLSVCMIVKDAESDILRCLKSVTPYAQEIIIGIDEATRDGTEAIISAYAAQNPLVTWQVFSLPTVSGTGFDAARNATIERAGGDWILWIDSDEVLFGAENLPRYLRRNQFTGYAVKQHHMSVEPLGVLKTDLPCRIFRNGKGVRFFGMVHEHPEIGLNEGIGHVCLAQGLEIIHHGYSTEKVRRSRFDRNIRLLEQDRKAYPERWLGKFLWLRDLAQMCGYDIESGNIDQQLFQYRADEGIKIWEELLDCGQSRIAIDGLPYYSELVSIKGEGFDLGVKVGASKLNGGVHLDREQEIAGRFATREHFDRLVKLVTDEKTEGFDSRYY